MAGEKEQHARRDQLVLGQALAFVLEVHELAQQIAARLAPALGNKRAEELGHLARGAFRARVLSGRLARAADE